MIEQRLHSPGGALAGPTLWVLSLSSLVLAVGAVLIVVWIPKAVAIAVPLVFLAVLSRGLYSRMKASTRTRTHTEASAAVANLGLVIAGLVVTPLLAFAVLWISLLALVGAGWLLHVLHIA